LFGDRMYIANATGCSSIWGNSSPSTPYTVNKQGRGPAWDNSLFEDNAEFGFGMFLAQKTLRGNLKDRLEKLAEADTSLKGALDKWVETYDSTLLNTDATAELVEALNKNGSDAAKEILNNKDFLAKKSQWIFGGDGWAYDIGFGGLDHVLASGEDVNVFVFNTEVYSNTGGQSSKATPTGAVAQFAAGGKEIKQKDLAAIAMSYGYVYVAQVSMGANMAQLVKAISEAEAYHGPSLIIGYAPCINHRIRVGMGKSIEEEKKAVQAGYWNLFRYNPAGGDKKFTLDSKAATMPYREFLDGEARYTALKKVNSEKAEALFDAAAKNAEKHYAYLEKLNDLYNK
ncbi:MAG: pyruvate:ferredoxin (flavodoxin) oxidoreductase, partial [Lachnospiraceae bacterium]|nr:pyruvate:ferredoxin (flavodoxin) oxidoreductase [Lachnospiraceae bacterium]